MAWQLITRTDEDEALAPLWNYHTRRRRAYQLIAGLTGLWKHGRDRRCYHYYE